MPLWAVYSSEGGPRYEWRSARSVDARAVIDSQDNDGVLIVVDLVDHSIRPSPCGVEPGEFALQATADAVGVVNECAQHELNNGGCGALCESFQLALSGTGDARFVRMVAVGHLEEKRARSSSRVM